jgi:outer membrane receptor protein involved in Fe transport
MMILPRTVFAILFIISSLWVNAQLTINGIVSDISTGKPLPGATIHQVNTFHGTTTDKDGAFHLAIPFKDEIEIKISFIGYKDTIIKLSVETGHIAEMNIGLQPLVFETSTVFITAYRTNTDPEKVPGRIAILSSQDIEKNSVLNADDVLATIPGINIGRDFGIFAKNSGITMRGLNSAQRTLILLDGVPINKTDGGSVNWNRINPESINRIEVMKGPVSTIYGGNAMSGVINIITDRPQKKLEGNLKTFYGTYNTFGGIANLGGQNFKKDKGLYYSLYGYGKKGDGYIIAPDSTRDSLDVNTYLWEYSGSAKVGYQFRSQSYIEVEYNYYDDKRGDGTSIFEPDGGYNKYTTNFVRSTASLGYEKTKILINAFYQYENYFRQSETRAVKKSNKYTLYLTDANRYDKGIWFNISRSISKNQAITAGVDTKTGSVDASDIYLTSSDILTNKGRMDFYAAFADYELTVLQDKLIIDLGLRYDMAQFSKGSFTIEDPSTLTSFMTAYPTEFSDTKWNAFSPKLAGKYLVGKNFSFYLSYSKGFRPPMLDDMCKNGNISKGFKIANPELEPETLDNYEFGYDLNLWKNVKIEHSIYYSLGKDFQYFVANGDSVYTGGDNLKPMLKRENISKVQVIGTEISVEYAMLKNLLFIANYAYNNSTILEFYSKSNPAKDLTGKFLMEVPPHQFFVGAYWKNRFFNASSSYSFVDAQWSDDENIIRSESRYYFDMKLSKIFYEDFTAAVTVHDILNNRRVVDTKGNLSPGRFIMLSLSYKI